MGLLDDVTKHPKGYQTVFLHDGEQRLTAAKIIEEVFLIQYSEGIDAAREGQVIEYWQNYLFDIEGTKLIWGLISLPKIVRSDADCGHDDLVSDSKFSTKKLAKCSKILL